MPDRVRWPELPWRSDAFNRRKRRQAAHPERRPLDQLLRDDLEPDARSAVAEEALAWCQKFISGPEDLCFVCDDLWAMRLPQPQATQVARLAVSRSRGPVEMTVEALPVSFGHVAQAKIDDGVRPGTTTDEAARIAELERGNRELRRANEILKIASAFFTQAELDRRLN